MYISVIKILCLNILLILSRLIIYLKERIINKIRRIVAICEGNNKVEGFKIINIRSMMSVFGD